MALMNGLSPVRPHFILNPALTPQDVVLAIINTLSPVKPLF